MVRFLSEAPISVHLSIAAVRTTHQSFSSRPRRRPTNQHPSHTPCLTHYHHPHLPRASPTTPTKFHSSVMFLPRTSLTCLNPTSLNHFLLVPCGRHLRRTLASQETDKRHSQLLTPIRWQSLCRRLSCQQASSQNEIGIWIRLAVQDPCPIPLRRRPTPSSLALLHRLQGSERSHSLATSLEAQQHLSTAALQRCHLNHSARVPTSLARRR